VVFFAYTVIAIPLLLVLLVQFAMHAPGYVATGWHSAATLKDALIADLGAGDIAGAAGVTAELLILTMPTIAAMVLSLVLGTWLASSLWRRRRSAPRGTPLPA
jgi:hypothetical protein